MTDTDIFGLSDFYAELPAELITTEENENLTIERAFIDGNIKMNDFLFNYGFQVFYTPDRSINIWINKKTLQILKIFRGEVILETFNKPKAFNLKLLDLENLYDFDIIDVCHVDEMEEVGILFNIELLNPEWEKGPFNYVTMNLLKKHEYFKGDTPNIPNIVDLLQQCYVFLKNKTLNFKREIDYFYVLEIELPSGQIQTVNLEFNETGKFTIMLPEDH